MAVLNAGLVINGIPLIRSVYSSSETSVDPYIETGLFTAILSFAKRVFDDDPEEMRFSKYIIIIKNLSANQSQPKFLFATAERGTDKNEIKRRLNKIKEKIDSDELPLDMAAGATKEIDQIKKIIDEEFEALSKTTAERVKSIFGD